MNEALIVLGITTAIGIIGFFLVRFINHTDRLAESIDKLNISITGINGVLLSVQENNEKTDGALRKHSEELEDHEKRIIIIETTMRNAT